jgi:hypothetical protein
MNGLIDDARELLQRIEAGKYIYTDDAPFNIPKFDGARLLSLDPTIRHTTLFPQKLLKNDGSIAVQIVESLAPSRPELKEVNQTFSEGSREGLTMRSFPSSNTIRAANSMDETQIDLCSTNNSTRLHASARISAVACRCQSGFLSEPHSRSRDQLLIC